MNEIKLVSCDFINDLKPLEDDFQAVWLENITEMMLHNVLMNSSEVK